MPAASSAIKAVVNRAVSSASSTPGSTRENLDLDRASIQREHRRDRERADVGRTGLDIVVIAGEVVQTRTKGRGPAPLMHVDSVSTARP